MSEPDEAKKCLTTASWFTLRPPMIPSVPQSRHSITPAADKTPRIRTQPQSEADPVPTHILYFGGRWRRAFVAGTHLVVFHCT